MKRYGEPHGGLWYACCKYDNKEGDESAKVVIILPIESSVNVIAHESYHAIQKFMETIGENNKREFFAYHLGYFVGEIYDFINKIRNDKKKA